MKTKEYVLKYELNKNDKFDHTEFASDLSIDFMTLLEVGKGNERLKGFENAVNAIRMKFDAINNKTVGIIPEKLWNYFFATVIAPLREELFPKEMKRRKYERESRQRRHDEYQDMFNDFNQDSFFNRIANLYKALQKPVTSFLLLGLTLDANSEDVKKAYRALAMKHHPDKGGKQSIFIGMTEAKNKCLAYLSKSTENEE